MAESERIAAQTRAMEWAGGESVRDNLSVLDVALSQLQQLQKGVDEGPPVGLGWGMYRGAEAHARVLEEYSAQFARGIITPGMQVLVGRLYRASPGSYLDSREALALYLMLGNPQHLEIDWAAPRLSRILRDHTWLSSVMRQPAMKQRLRPHLEYFLQQLKAGRIAPVQVYEQPVASARAQLAAMPDEDRLYALLVESVGALQVDDWEDASAENAVFPPIRLSTLFGEGPDTRLVIKSKLDLAGHGEGRVPGIFTARGRHAVGQQLRHAQGILEAERWLEPSRAVDVGSLQRELRGVVARYDEVYGVAWIDFFLDVKAASPTTTGDALAQLKTLTTKPYPYATLLAALRENVQAPRDDPFERDPPLLREAVRRLESRWNAYPAPAANAPALRPASRWQLSNAAGNGVVDFAFPPEGYASEPSLDRYVGILTSLQPKLVQAKARGVQLSDLASDFETARAEAWTLIDSHDARTRQFMAPMLLAPLGESVDEAAPITGSATRPAAP